MTKIYVVRAESLAGNTWLVAAYADYGLALAHVDRAAAGQKAQRKTDLNRRAAPLDIFFDVEEVDLLDTVPA